MQRIVRLASIVCLIVFSATAALAGYAEGKVAYDRGDYATALRELTITANQGQRESQYLLGVMHERGRGVAQDDREAVRWYRLSADKGHILAQNNLGFMYEKGRGVEQSFAEAIRWYRKAAEAGDALAQTNLGSMYENGRGTPQDYPEAIRWYERGAGQGYAAAQTNLGYAYERGRGVAQDYAQALAWYSKAAEAGHARGQTNLGYLYEKGFGVAQDYVEALRWYRKGADGGNVQAQFNLGTMYENGRGTQLDDAEAVRWYRKAADGGLAKGQAFLADMLAEGKGVGKDFAEAKRLYEAAIKGGYADAGEQLAALLRDNAAAFGPAAGGEPVPSTGRRVALVIGNAAYVSAPLNNPETDLGIVVPALQQMGFQVTQIANADIHVFDKALQAFAEAADGAEIALFYYAGHGFALNDGINVRNYPMSTSADVTETSDRILRRDSIPLDEIIDEVSAVANTSLFFVDACRNDPRVTRGRGTGRGLASVGGGTEEVFVGLSTRIGDVAEDGKPGEGSPFARAFAANMATPGLTLNEAFRKVRLAVTAEVPTQRPEADRDDLSAPVMLVGG